MRLALTFLLALVSHWFEPASQFLTRRRFLREAKFIVDYLHQLSITPLSVHNVSNSFDCAFKCIEFDGCLSFNLAKFPSGGLKVCQLLPTDKYNSSQHFNSSTSFDYYSISLGVAHGNHYPCKNGGKFQHFYWTGEYKCKCSPVTEGMHCEWLKSNTNALKVEPKDSKPGKFYAPKSGQIKRFKLVYVSGGLTCWDIWPPTHFGCAYFNTVLLCMMITDSLNNVVSPPQSYYQSHNLKCYNIPGVSCNDTELILPEISPALNVVAGQELRVWYAEDLFKIFESDNIGVLYADVYVEYVN